MSNYDLRAREWDQRMKAADTTKGEPLAEEQSGPVKEDPSVTSAYLNAIYPPPHMGRFWGKNQLLELAANLYIYNVPFPPRMRSDLVNFRVTPEHFEARTYLMLMMIDIETGLPEEAKRPEVQDLYARWAAKPVEPLKTKDLQDLPHLTAIDKRHYMQLYDIPLVPGGGKPSGRTGLVVKHSAPAMDVIQSDPKHKELLDSVHADLLGSNKLDPFAHHQPSLRSAMIARPADAQNKS